MRLVVFHYHDRPGGVRQVIARGLPQLVERLGSVREVVLLLGTLTDPDWVQDLGSSLGGISLRCVTHPDFGYLSGQHQGMGTGASGLLREMLSGEEVLVWAHNLSVGRNLPLLRLLPEHCAASGATLWLHHHDWWWDGRWARWGDWQSAGVETLEEALEQSVPEGPHIRHWCVNQSDLAWLQQRVGDAAQWVGNPLPDLSLPGSREVREAAAWLNEISGGRRVWLAPVRALRRKNLAETLRLLPGGPLGDHGICLVTTGGPSSPSEEPAWRNLCETAVRLGWPLVPGILSVPPDAPAGSLSLAGAGGPRPRVTALMAAADAVVMTSLQEGFGLPYLEAAALDKPLLVRALPGVTANLAGAGCTLPATYASVAVPAAQFDAAAERRRCQDRWQRLQCWLPSALRIPYPAMESGVPLDFGGLSLQAQLEVLSGNGNLPPVGVCPRVPVWPQASRIDHWVDRFFQPPEPVAANTGCPLLPEVMLRFRHWARHPLLWP